MAGRAGDADQFQSCGEIGLGKGQADGQAIGAVRVRHQAEPFQVLHKGLAGLGIGQGAQEADRENLGALAGVIKFSLACAVDAVGIGKVQDLGIRLIVHDRRILARPEIQGGANVENDQEREQLQR